MTKASYTERDYPCAMPVERCVNKQKWEPGWRMWACHGSSDPRCYVNWASCDPEDLEPYEQYLAELKEPLPRGSEAGEQSLAQHVHPSEKIQHEADSAPQDQPLR